MTSNQSPDPSQSQATHGTHSNYISHTRLMPKKLASGFLYRDSAPPSAAISRHTRHPRSSMPPNDEGERLSTVEPRPEGGVSHGGQKRIEVVELQNASSVSLAIKAIKSRPSQAAIAAASSGGGLNSRETQIQTRDQETGSLAQSNSNTQPGLLRNNYSRFGL